MNPPLPDRLATLIADLPRETLAFTPVPVKARHNGWTVERQRGFIARLALCGCPATAARAVGMSRESAYRLRARPDADSFASAWDRALDLGVGRMEDLAIERAILGEVRPVFYRGRRVGEHVHHDTRLLIATLERTTRAERHAATEKSRLSRPSPGDLCDP